MEIARGVDLMILDSLIKFHSRSEDRASEIKYVMEKLKEIANKRNVAIIIIHQRRKPGQSETGEINASRGSLQIVYDSDMAYSLREAKGEERILECTKSRIVKEPPPFKFQIEEVGDKVQLVYRGEYDEEASKTERARSRLPIILQESEFPLPIEEILITLRDRGIDVGESTLRPILRDLEEHKVINSKTGDRGKKFYFYPQEEDVDESEQGQEGDKDADDTKDPWEF